MGTNEYLLHFVETIDYVKWLFFRVCQKRAKHPLDSLSTEINEIWYNLSLSYIKHK